MHQARLVLDLTVALWGQLPEFINASKLLYNLKMPDHIDGLVQERRNPIANALELVLLALTHRFKSGHSL